MDKRKKKLILIAYLIFLSILVIIAINTYLSLIEHNWEIADKEDVQTFGIIGVVGIVVYGIVSSVVLMKHLDNLCKKSEENKKHKPYDPH